MLMSFFLRPIFAEVSSTDKIEYVEMNGVDYGFVPSSVTRRCGFMRFQPNAIKAKTPNFAEVVSVFFLLKF